MPVPNTMADLATLASSNYPTGTESIGNSLDDYLRSHAAIIRSTNAQASSTIASASTTDIGAADGASVIVTGSSTINSFGTGFVGCLREVRFQSGLTITHSSGGIVLPGSVNLTVAPGDAATFRCTGSGVWVFVSGSGAFVRKSGDAMTGDLSTLGSLSAVGTVTGNSTGSGAVPAFIIGNDSALWDINAAGAAALRGTSNQAQGRLYFGNAGTTYYGVDSSNGAITEMGTGQYLQTIVNSGVIHYRYNNSQHIAEYKRAGGYSWYWRTNSTGTPSGTGETQVMELNNSGDLNVSGNLVSNSDERLKTNWRDLPDDLVERIASAKFGVYDRIDSGDVQAGVSAQSWREVIPETVRESDEGLLSVVYGNAALVGLCALSKRFLQLEKAVKGGEK